MIQDSIRRMVERDIRPVLKAHDPDKPLPKEAMRRISAASAPARA